MQVRCAAMHLTTETFAKNAMRILTRMAAAADVGGSGSTAAASRLVLPVRGARRDSCLTISCSADMADADDSLNEGYFISLPKERRRELASAIRRDMGDRIGRAAITFMAFAHYAALCEQKGGAHAEWDRRALKCADFAKQAIGEAATAIGPLLDLRTAHVQRYSTKQALELLDMAVDGIRHSDAPPGDIATNLVLFSDTIHAIIDIDRRPLYRLCGCGGPPIRIRDTPGHLGLSVELLIAINILLTDLHDPACLEDLHKSIIDAPPLPCTRPGDSAAALSFLAMHELWRQATLVLFYTLGLGLGCIASEIQQCLIQAKKIAPSLQPLSPPIPFWASASACPWFVLSTVAMREDERDMCRGYLSSAGSSPTYKANQAFIERLWARMDETGHPVDFRAMVKEGYNLGFL